MRARDVQRSTYYSILVMDSETPIRPGLQTKLLFATPVKSQGRSNMFTLDPNLGLTPARAVIVKSLLEGTVFSVAPQAEDKKLVSQTSNLFGGVDMDTQMVCLS